MNDDFETIIGRLDDVAADLLPRLRVKKEIDDRALADLNRIMDELQERYRDEELLPRRLCWNLWYIFSQMLIEADHCREPEPILSVAWSYQYRLVRFFGPKTYYGTPEEIFGSP